MRVPLFICIIITACNTGTSSIDGSYELVAAKYGDSVVTSENLKRHRTVKILKSGYWISATSCEQREVNLEKCSGGMYNIRDGRYIETILFNSEENLDKMEIDTFDYSINDNRYIQKGVINTLTCEQCNLSEEFHKAAINKKLIDKSLEGVWQIVTQEWFGNQNKERDFTQIKIYSYPYFIWAQYKPEAKEFLGVGGGTYQYDGHKLTEHLEYFSYFDIIPGNHDIEVTKRSSNEILQISGDGAGKEIWKKIN